MKDRIIQAAESLNPENPTQEQKFRRSQLFAFCQSIEEDEDALYRGTSYRADLLSDSSLRKYLNIICNADYSLGGRGADGSWACATPHFLTPDGDFLMSGFD